VLVGSEGGNSGERLPGMSERFFTVDAGAVLSFVIIQRSFQVEQTTSIDSHSLDHVANDAVGFSWPSVVGRDTVPEHLQGGVTGNAIFSTEVGLFRTVDLGKLDILALELGGSFLVVRRQAIISFMLADQASLTRTFYNAHTLNVSK
jgi:hypothetical protein